MPDVYEKPTARAKDDFNQYISLLLGAIDAELMRPDVWEDADREDALLYIDDLKTYLIELPQILMSQQSITEIDISSGTVFPVLIKTVLAGETVDEVLLTVDTPFDTGVLSIGDDGDNSRLMSADSNSLALAEQFQLSPQVRYSSGTAIYAYLTGTPSTGSARITLYSYLSQG